MGIQSGEAIGVNRADPERVPALRCRDQSTPAAPCSSHHCFYVNKRELRGQERAHPGQAQGQGLASVGVETTYSTVTHLHSFTHFTLFSH